MKLTGMNVIIWIVKGWNIKGENKKYEIVKIYLERWNDKDEIVRMK